MSIFVWIDQFSKNFDKSLISKNDVEAIPILISQQIKMAYALCTKLTIPYDVCVRHINRNMRRSLQVGIIRQNIPDVISTLPLESISSMEITYIEESECEVDECLKGTIMYEGNTYIFRTHRSMYDVVLIMQKTNYPFDKIRMILPITVGALSANTNTNTNNSQMIYIPFKYIGEDGKIPIEFVWEFLVQLPNYNSDNLV